MERTIYVEPIMKRYAVELKDANRERRNRSYSNASPCCSKEGHAVKLKQEMKCAECESLVDRKTCTHKVVKIGKEEFLIEAAVLDGVLEQLEQVEEITITAISDSEPEGARDRYDALVYGLPVEKKAKEYKELAETLKGKVAIGAGVFRGNEFQVVVTVGDDGLLRVRKLVEESQRYGVEAQALTALLSKVEVSPQVVELQRKVLEKKKVDAFDVTVFRDRRGEMEEQVIEEVVVHGRVPSFAPRIVEEQKAESEVERLKALLGE
jgi:NAD kinase